jgi:universal stress protein E
MKRLSYILAVLDRGPMDSALLTKAAALGAHFNGRLELFLCDAERAYVMKHDYEPSHNDELRRTCLAQAIEYLQSLRTVVKLPEERVSASAACESPLYEGIVRKVLQSRPDLVVKGASGLESPARPVFDSNDWQLMRKCPTTLMMTRGRIWRNRPRFAAAVDISAQETAGLAGAILSTAEALRLVHGAELDVLYAEPDNVSGEAREARLSVLQGVTQSYNVRADSLRILNGKAEEALPAFAAERDYDAIVMGALTHRPGAVALVGTLTSKLVDTVPCDFVLVKPQD